MQRQELQTCVENAFTQIPQIKSFTLHGSLAKGTDDDYSDLDYQLDVSGVDNGRFMLDLPDLLKEYLDIGWVAFGPRFAPELYLVTIWFEGTDLFHFVDIECLATPHVPSVSQAELRGHAFGKNVMFKLLLNGLKSVLRGPLKGPSEFEINGIFNALFPGCAQADMVGKLEKCLEYFSVHGGGVIPGLATNALSMLRTPTIE